MFSTSNINVDDGNSALSIKIKRITWNGRDVYIKVLQWNCDNLGGKEGFLQDVIKQNGIYIVLLNEPYKWYTVKNPDGVSVERTKHYKLPEIP